MSKRKTLKLRLHRREGRRLILDEDEWVAVKNAIDTARFIEDDEESIAVLKEYNLWDEENDCPDEDEIHTLYHRGA